MKKCFGFKRFSLFAIPIFILLLYVAPVTAADFDSAFETLGGFLESFGSFVGFAFENGAVRNAVVSIFGVVFFYALYYIGLSRTPIMSGSDESVQKKGKLIAISLSIISTIGLYYLMQQNGGIKSTLEIFGNVAVWVISITFAMVIYFFGKDLLPQDKPSAKSWLTLLSLGASLWFFGSMAEGGLDTWGFIFLLIGGIGFAVVKFSRNPAQLGQSARGGFGVKSFVDGFKGKVSGNSGNGNKGSDDTSSGQNIKALSQIKSDFKNIENADKKIHHIEDKVALKSKIEQEHYNILNEGLQAVAQSQKNLMALKKKINDLATTNYESLKKLFQSGEVEKIYNSVIENITKKIEHYAKRDKKGSVRISRALKKISKEIGNDKVNIQKVLDELNNNWNNYSPNQQQEANKMLEDFNRYKQFLGQIEEYVNYLKEIEAKIEKEYQEALKYNKGAGSKIKKTLGKEKGALHRVESIKSNFNELTSGLETDSKKVAMEDFKSFIADLKQKILPKIDETIQFEEEIKNKDWEILKSIHDSNQNFYNYLAKLTQLINQEEHDVEELEKLVDKVEDLETQYKEMETETNEAQSQSPGENPDDVAKGLTGN